MSSFKKLKKIAPKLATLALIVVASIAVFMLYGRYMEKPWTRDGQVRADVVKITPRVNGYLVNIAIGDNQLVRAGQLLFQIDPAPFQLEVDQAKVRLDQAREDVASREVAVEVADATIKQQEAAVESARGKVDEAQAGIESAKAAVKEAESAILSAKAYIKQMEATLEEAKREAARAKRLADKTAGSVEVAEAKAASVVAYTAQLDSARAGLQQAEATLEKTKASESEAEAKKVIAENELAQAQAAVTTALADRDQAKANLGEPGEANVSVRNAKVELEQAELNLSWTSIYAPSDGYITNMSLLNSTFVSTGTPFALFVDSASFRVDAYFQETKLKNVNPGDQAVVTLMGYDDQPIEGEVESIGYAINPPNHAATDGPENLVPQIQPTFEWIRLAQRVPVRIRLKNIPEDIQLVSGTTASVAIKN